MPDTVHHCVYEIDPKRDLPFPLGEMAVHSKNPGIEVPHDEVHSKASLSNFDRDKLTYLEWSQKTKIQKFKMVAKLADGFKMTQCLVFCRTNVDCNNLEKYLNALGGSRGVFQGKVETGKGRRLL